MSILIGPSPRRVLRLAVKFLFTVIVIGLAARNIDAGNLTYVYDADSRLIAVIDGSGNAASYNYDNEGNLLSVSRSTGSTVSVFAVSPNNGPAGTPVTVYGNGFSATASQDTVYFCTGLLQCGTSGVHATVTSATTTTLAVTVPSNVTPGPVYVQCPAGSASGGFFN